jgi:hypothetical protein
MQHGEWGTMVESDLPFNGHTAHKLMHALRRQAIRQPHLRPHAVEKVRRHALAARRRDHMIDGGLPRRISRQQGQRRSRSALVPAELLERLLSIEEANQLLKRLDEKHK